ncbi:hypothetical protein GGR54DRAFT_468400 [Hypoxylon sp. NC1633]|nr:hypothetical protein GGR54DRAFT_468400 [Hypoxylon sp. NC1633]
MADQHTGNAATDRLQEKDVSIRTQTIVWPASTFITTWTLGGGSDPTESPATVVPASSPNAGDQNVGPILSSVVVFIVLVLVIWVCCRRSEFFFFLEYCRQPALIMTRLDRSNGRASRRSSRRHGSGYSGKGGSGSSSGSATSNDSSRNGRSVGSAASETAEDQWEQPEPVPEVPMPGMPPPVAGGWPGPQPGPGMRAAPPHAPEMGFHYAQGGGPPMMVRGGQPMARGGPPPMMGRGGPPPGVMQ